MLDSHGAIGDVKEVKNPYGRWCVVCLVKLKLTGHDKVTKCRGNGTGCSPSSSSDGERADGQRIFKHPDPEPVSLRGLHKRATRLGSGWFYTATSLTQTRGADRGNIRSPADGREQMMESIFLILSSVFWGSFFPFSVLLFYGFLNVEQYMVTVIALHQLLPFGLFKTPLYSSSACFHLILHTST